jgi:hypothetical protein
VPYAGYNFCVPPPGVEIEELAAGFGTGFPVEYLCHVLAEIFGIGGRHELNPSSGSKPKRQTKA